MAYATWNTAVAGAKAGTHRAKILFIGDSIATGENASSRATRIQELLVSTLRSNFGLSTGGQGLSPAIGFSTYLSSDASWKTPFTTSGTTGTATTATTQGDQGIYLNSGAYITRTVNGDSADLVYLGVSTGLGGITWGTITVAVDGTTVGTLTPTASGALAPGQIYHFSLGTAGSHTVKYTATGGAVIIDGDVIYNGDYTAGIASWDASHVGYESEDTLAQMGTSGVTSGSGAGNWAGWQNFGPDLVIIDQLGLNDLLNGDAAPSVCASDLSTVLTGLKALSSNPSILVFAPLRLPGIESGVNGSYYVADYVSAGKTVATGAGATVNWLDLNDVYPYASIPSSWYTGDSAALHPNDTGQAAEVSAIAPLLEPATSSDAGTGAITAGAPTVSGTGTQKVTGTGAVTAAAPAVAGTGTEKVTGTGAVTAGSPAVSGTGTQKVTGTGAITPGSPTVSETPSGTVLGTGAIVAAAPVVAGTGTETITGTGAVVAGGPTIHSAPATPNWIKTASGWVDLGAAWDNNTLWVNGPNGWVNKQNGKNLYLNAPNGWQQIA